MAVGKRRPSCVARSPGARFEWGREKRALREKGKSPFLPTLDPQLEE